MRKRRGAGDLEAAVNKGERGKIHNLCLSVFLRSFMSACFQCVQHRGLIIYYAVESQKDEESSTRLCVCLCGALTVGAELIPCAQFSLKQATWDRNTERKLTCIFTVISMETITLMHIQRAQMRPSELNLGFFILMRLLSGNQNTHNFQPVLHIQMLPKSMQVVHCTYYLVRIILLFNDTGVLITLWPELTPKFN